MRLVDLDGLSYQEAADVLGVPIGTVMRRLHRARHRLRGRLDESLSRLQDFARRLTAGEDHDPPPA